MLTHVGVAVVTLGPWSTLAGTYQGLYCVGCGLERDRVRAMCNWGGALQSIQPRITARRSDRHPHRCQDVRPIISVDADHRQIVQHTVALRLRAFSTQATRGVLQLGLRVGGKMACTFTIAPSRGSAVCRARALPYSCEPSRPQGGRVLPRCRVCCRLASWPAQARAVMAGHRATRQGRHLEGVELGRQVQLVILSPHGYHRWRRLGRRGRGCGARDSFKGAR